MPVPIVTIFGGSGFIGRQIAQRMARAGWRVRVAVRRPNEANFVRPYGVVGPGRADPGQHPRRGLDPRRHRRGRGGRQLRRHHGRGRPADLRGGGGRRRRPDRPDQRRGRASPASSTSPPSAPTRRATASTPPPRGAARRRCARAFPGAVILRPSIVFGSDDSFFNRFGAMARLHAGPAARRTGDPLPAGLRQRRGRGRRGRRHRPTPRPASTSSAAPRSPPSAS